MRIRDKEGGQPDTQGGEKTREEKLSIVLLKNM